MPFSIITIRSQEEDGAALYPSLDAVNITPSLEAGESSPRRLTARSLEIYDFEGGLNQIISLDDLKFDVAITDSRVVVWCRKFDKGGGWRGMGIGGLAFAAAANTVSHARAASRRKGKCLVGHIRYPWLKKVGYLAKQGMFTSQEEIRLLIEDGTAGANGRTMALDLKLGSSESARAVAEDILRRAVDFRLAHAPDLDPEKRRALEELRRSGIPRTTETGKFTMVELPGAWVVRGDTAHYPDPSETESDTVEAGNGEIASALDPEPESDEDLRSADVTEWDQSPRRSPESANSLADFCHRCGNRFEDPELFCPDCGTERRTKIRSRTAPPDADSPGTNAFDDDSAGGSAETEDGSTIASDHASDSMAMAESTVEDDPDSPESEEEQAHGVLSIGQAAATPPNDKADQSSRDPRSSDRQSVFPCPACDRELPMAARFCAGCGGATSLPNDEVALDPDRTVRRPRPT